MEQSNERPNIVIVTSPTKKDYALFDNPELEQELSRKGIMLYTPEEALALLQTKPLNGWLINEEEGTGRYILNPYDGQYYECRTNEKKLLEEFELAKLWAIQGALKWMGAKEITIDHKTTEEGDTTVDMGGGVGKGSYGAEANFKMNKSFVEKNRKQLDYYSKENKPRSYAEVENYVREHGLVHEHIVNRCLEDLKAYGEIKEEEISSIVTVQQELQNSIEASAKIKLPIFKANAEFNNTFKGKYELTIEIKAKF